MGSNLPHTDDEETTLDFDEIEDYSDDAWKITIDDKSYFMPKSQVRVYHKPKVMYVPNWLLAKKGLL